MHEFAGQTAVITGAASGIGRALAMHALSLGMNVVGADRDPAGLTNLATGTSRSPRLMTRQVDVTVDAEMCNLADEAYRRFGEVHMLFNNAGTSCTGAVWEIDPAAWGHVLDINFMGAVRGAYVFVPRMLASGTRAAIVNTASMAAVGAAAGLGPYVASKHALLGMSESLYYDLRARGAPISVSLLCPGPVHTGIMHASVRKEDGDLFRSAKMRAALAKMIDAGMEPEDVAAIAFDGIAAGRFWIFTHPELLAQAKARHAAMTGSGMIDA
jgi:NAD(P)-dependent dehydrogenase (short-subunit alcohol dehydrogenase family)